MAKPSILARAVKEGRLNVKKQRRKVYATLMVRSRKVIDVLIVTLLILYFLWKSSKEHLFAWMRFHLWGHPGSHASID